VSVYVFTAFILIAVYSALVAGFCEFLSNDAKIYWWIFSMSMFFLILIKLATGIIRFYLVKGA